MAILQSVILQKHQEMSLVLQVGVIFVYLNRKNLLLIIYLFILLAIRREALQKALKVRRMSSRRLLDDASAADRDAATETRDMMERHAMQIAQLENELRSEEINKINEV